jgi:protein SDA1
VTHILAYLVQASHVLVPPDDLLPVIKAIAFNFVTERCTGDVMAVGINVIKEVIKRVSAVLDEPGMDAFVQDICAYSRNRDKSVVVAARGFTNLIREIYPSLLRGRDRGKHHDITAKPAAYGAENVLEGVEGAELLTLADAGIITIDSSSDSDNDNDDDDDEWQDVNSDNDNDIDDIDDSNAIDSTTATANDDANTLLAAAAEHDGWEECSSESNDEEEYSEEGSEQGDAADFDAEDSDDGSDGMEVEEDSEVEDSETETTETTTVKSSSSRVMFADSVKSHDGSNEVAAVVTSSKQSSSSAVIQKKADDGMEIDLRSIQVIQSKRADATRILTAEVCTLCYNYYYYKVYIMSIQTLQHYKVCASLQCVILTVFFICRYC